MSFPMVGRCLLQRLSSTCLRQADKMTPLHDVTFSVNFKIHVYYNNYYNEEEL